MANAKIVILSPANFDQEVLKSATPVLVDFWATWCGPCKMIAPILDQLADELAGKIKIAKLDVGESDNQDLATRYQITNIPTLLLVKGGKVVEVMRGARDKKSIAQVVAPHLA
jgi:thioredoxin 1